MEKKLLPFYWFRPFIALNKLSNWNWVLKLLAHQMIVLIVITTLFIEWFIMDRIFGKMLKQNYCEMSSHILKIVRVNSQFIKVASTSKATQNQKWADLNEFSCLRSNCFSSHKFFILFRIYVESVFMWTFSLTWVSITLTFYLCLLSHPLQIKRQSNIRIFYLPWIKDCKTQKQQVNKQQMTDIQSVREHIIV